MAVSGKMSMAVSEKKINNQNLNYLRILTDQLPVFPHEIGPEVPGVKEYKMECGTCLSWNLLNQEEISCARWFNSSGTRFPVHAHDEKEFLIVYQGSLFVEINNKEQALNPGDSLIIEPRTPHSSRSLEDCWYLAITIPKSESWPK